MINSFAKLWGTPDRIAIGTATGPDGTITVVCARWSPFTMAAALVLTIFGAALVLHIVHRTEDLYRPYAGVVVAKGEEAWDWFAS